MSVIHDLNELLTCLDDLTENIQETKIGYLKARYTSRPNDYVQAVTGLAEKMNLVYTMDDKIGLKEHGIKFLEKISVVGNQKFFDPTKEQIDFLRNMFFEEEQFLEEFRKIMAEFWEDTTKEPMLTCVLRKNTRFDRFIISYLEEIGIFEVQYAKDEDEKTRINCKNYLQNISKIRNQIKEVSEEELAKRLAENTVIGKKGEQYAIEYEKKRLEKDEDRIDLAYDLKQVSLTDVHAGFDIKSYDDKNSQLRQHDRMIEVKATRSSSPRFYWSKNEVIKAEKLREKYWIYLWINVESPDRNLIPIKIQNPYEKFFEGKSEDEKPQCTGYFLDKRLIGKIQN